MPHQAVLFDLDGTLLDTLEDLADSMNSVLERYGFPLHGVEAYKYFVGDGMENLVRRALPQEDRSEPQVNACLAAMREQYGKKWREKTRPYSGIPELLSALKARHLRMAILSNKPDDFTKIMVHSFLADAQFELVLGARIAVPKKPDPTVALDIAKRFRLPPSAFLYLGDTDTDMKTATASGMYAVGVLWGFRKADELIAAGAKVLIERPADVLELL